MSGLNLVADFVLFVVLIVLCVSSLLVLLIYSFSVWRHTLGPNPVRALLPRVRLRPAPWWAWVLLALCPTVGYLVAEAVVRWRSG